MIAYVLKRILLMIPTLLGITLVTFFVMKLAPGDPVQLQLMFAGDNISQEALAAALQKQEPVVQLSDGYLDFTENFSKKIHSQSKEIKDTFTYKSLEWIGENTLLYLKWAGNIVFLDFGYSIKDKLPVLDKIKEALPKTLLINILSILIIYFVSVPLGIWSALNRETILDKIVMVLLFIFYSLPTFWVATMLLMYLAGSEYLNWFPMLGLMSDDFEQLSMMGKVMDVAWHLVLPVAASTLGGFAFLTRFSRSNFLDVIKSDFVRTARAKGLTETKVIFKHALRNALIPFVTLMGTLLPALLGGSVIIEQIFSIPGMGMLSFEAVLGRDHNVIMAIATISAFLTLLSLFLSDLLYKVVDPRISLK